jgi:hypothetical protein
LKIPSKKKRIFPNAPQDSLVSVIQKFWFFQKKKSTILKISTFFQIISVEPAKVLGYYRTSGKKEKKEKEKEKGAPWKKRVPSSKFP